MENLKNYITDIIKKYETDETSSTGITGEKIIYSDSADSIAEEILNIIQIVFDPENQPNQLGIANPYRENK